MPNFDTIVDQMVLDLENDVEGMAFNLRDWSHAEDEENDGERG